MEKEETKENVTEVEYPNPALYKRWFAAIIDIFVMLVVAALLYGISMLVTDKVPSYSNAVSQRDELQLDSNLYVKDDNKIVLLTTSLDDSEATDLEKKNKYSSALDSFYSNTTFFSDSSGLEAYSSRKKAATDSNGDLIFVLSGDNYIENGFSDSIYCDFYSREINNYASSQLSLNSDYSFDNRVIVVTSVVEIFICGAIGFTFSFILMPLFIKRGRRTIGMYLFKISLIGVDALNVKGKTLVFRNLLLFFIGYVLNLVTVLIPLIVSISMMHLSKSHQDFFDYISNTYVVDSSRKDVYLDYYEYYSRNALKEEASIEKNDLTLTNKK